MATRVALGARVSARPSRGGALHRALLAGVSALALVAGSTHATARSLGGSAAPAPSAAATAAAQSAAQDAARAARDAQNALARATRAIQTMQATQQAARDAALAAGSAVPNGLRPAGLQVAPGAVPGSPLWQGASLPAERADAGRTKVTIGQTQQKAILTWQTFNVGKETDLVFDQQGNRDWIALNRVIDPSLAPSRILGTIKADGSVYVINRNGIIFGGSSQINVGSLIASSLDIKGLNTNLVADRDEAFLNGLFVSGSATFQSRKLPDSTGALVVPDAIEGNVVVEAGAVLRATSASGLYDGGRIMLFAPNIHNAGSIATPDGQAVLAAGRTVTVSVGADKQLAFTAGAAVPFGDPYYSNAAYAGEPAYRAQNTGLISAERGAIIMRATLIEQAGLLSATTSINRSGSVSLGADGRLTLRSGSSILMDADAMRDAEGKEVTAPAFNGGLSVSLSGSSVDVQTNTFIRAPSGAVSLTATNATALFETHRNVPDDNGRVFLAPGAVIDVSGLADVLVPIERAILKIQPRGQEFANSPLQRNSVLRGKDIWVDTRITGVRDDGVAWIGTPLFDASGYVGLIQKSTREYMIGGGSIAISGQKDIVMPQGVTLNVSGGYVRYTEGMVPVTRLIGADGRLYNVAKADPMMAYLGVYGGFTQSHARWGVSETWASPTLAARRREPGYVEGAAAGSLSVTGQASNLWGGAVYFDGTMIADTTNGERQIAQSKPAARGLLAITSQGSLVVSAQGQHLLGNIDSALPAPDLSLTSAGLGLWSWLSADKLSAIGLGSLSLTAPGALLVTGDAKVEVVPGGSIALTGGVIRVDGTLKAPAGSIELRTPRHPDAVIRPPAEVLSLLPSLPGGVLAPNTTAPMDLELLDGFVLPANTPLPFNTSYPTLVAFAGKALPALVTLPAQADVANQPVLAADWTVPVGAAFIRCFLPNGTAVFANPVGTVIPRGSRLFYGTLPPGYVIPTDAFPNGLRLTIPMMVPILAGQTAPINITFAAGSLIPEGARLPQAVRAAPTLGRFGSITVSRGGAIDTRGVWVDDRAAPSAYGAKFINGGNVIIATNASQFLNVDNTGSIVLAAGSTVDASSGGHILTSGVLESKNGVALGKGGDISIQVYAGLMFTFLSDIGAPTTPNGSATRADVRMRGALSSYGFSSGGALSLRAQTFGIGATVDAFGRVLLGNDFFHDNSFGSYTLSSVYETVIADGTAGARAIIAPRQRNYVATGAAMGIGADPLASGAVTTGLLSDYRRQAVNFAIDADTFHETTRGTSAAPIFDGANLLAVGANTTILADAGARVRLSSGGTLQFGGEIHAPGGTIELLGSKNPWRWATTSILSPTAAVWLMPTALLDARGTIQLDDMAPANVLYGNDLRIGRVLNGGTVTVAHEIGYVVGLQGARIDVSGVSGELDLLRSGNDLLSGIAPVVRTGFARPQNPYTRQAVWSDGGKINLSASAVLFFDSSLDARGGAPDARGGTITYTAFTQPVTLSGVPVPTVPTALAAGPNPQSLLNSYANQILIRTDIIGRSGADSLAVVSQTPSNRVGNIEDGVALSMLGSIRLDFDNVNMVAARVAPGQTASTNEPVAQFNASYIYLRGSTATTNPTANNVRGSLSFTADTLDLDGRLRFANLKTLNLTATGDIRLFGAEQGTNITIGGQTQRYPGFNGSLKTPGDITLKAAQVYPGTGQNFEITSTGAGRTIRFEQNGERPAAPLSAGGTLQVTATNIVQGGTIRAPQGSITLGVAGTTQSVTLRSGSLTSVSLEGAIVPYGTTQDGLNWISQTLDIANPPDKLIAINSASVTMAAGARLDLSAGGDLIAPEFIPGTGGSRDVLALGDRQVYAILPGLSRTKAPLDKTMGIPTTQYVSNIIVGGTQLNAGDVYLTGVPGLPDGYYTLLPAKYAVLPGAYRVVARPGGDPRSVGVRPDGTVISAGFYTSSDRSGRDANVTLFEVQSRDVWRQYSEYALTGANDFFGNLEVLHVDVAPFRPQDAGRLAINASNTLVLQAQTLFGTVAGGRGGRVDISGSALQIIGKGKTVNSGYLGLLATDLTNLQAESILLGGTRSADGIGRLVTTVANAILVSNDENSALVAPELLFAAKSSLVFEAGSFVVGEGAPAQATPLRTSGDGSLVRVSGGNQVTITASNVPASPVASVRIASGAQLVGKGSIALQSTGNVTLAAGAVLATRNIDVVTQSISLVGAGATGAPTTGFILDAQSLAALGRVDNIRLISATTIDSYGDVVIRLVRGGQQQTSLTFNASGLVGHGGSLSVEAARIAFINTTATVPVAAVSGGVALTLTADEIVFGAGDKQVSGFSRFDGAASRHVLAEGKGSADLGAMAVTLATPLLTTSAAADQSLRTAGALAVLGGTGSVPSADGLGGLLSLTGSAVTIDTAVVMPSGGMTLAATIGDIALGGNARLIATGFSKPMFDARIDTNAGAVALLAANGNIVGVPGAAIDVSASPLGGDAGAVTLQARGTVSLPGMLRGNASAGFAGGRFTLATGGTVALDALATMLMDGGFHDSVDVRSRQGNLALTGGLTALTVALTADGGLVYVSGLIDASGNKGGRIDLYGRDGVTLASGARLAATGSDADKCGGDIFIGTAGTGVITLAPGASIDVSGGTLAGLSGGTLHLRAPIVAGDVNVTVGAALRGARSVVVEAYRVFDTTGSNFDGVIDPLGQYDAAGNRLASGVNQAHSDFYNAELVAFVQNPGVSFARFAGIANVRGRVGIELRNSDSSRNNGDILLVSDWNLGAGSVTAGVPSLTWRTGVEPGVLTLRAAGTVDVRANLTDGFFNTSSTPVPHAADLMPASWGDSWSYRIVGGADLMSVNPEALRPLADFAASTGRGDVAISGHRTLVRGSGANVVTYELPNMIRTGTGFIDIAAGRDVALRDTVAPGVIYTAGRPSADLPSATFTTVNGQLVPDNPSGFVKPTVSTAWACMQGVSACGVSYLVTAPVWPEAAGDISIRAQRDVVGLQRVVDTTGKLVAQTWSPWLLRTGRVQPFLDLGIFNPNEHTIAEVGFTYDLGGGRQTASWINFASFNQGVMSVGGDVTIIAGRDVNQFSASLPTTVRVSGGISPLDPTTVAHVTGGGDLLVRAGRDIVSGAYYVGKGVGRLAAGGSFRSGWSTPEFVNGIRINSYPVSTVLGVADSTFTLSAGGAIDLAGVFSPTYVPVPGFWATDGISYTAMFTEYTRSSGVSLTAAGGDIAIKTFTARDDGLRLFRSAFSAEGAGLLYSESSTYDIGEVWPANLIVHAASGGINLASKGNATVLYPSPTGQLELIGERDVAFLGTNYGNLTLSGRNPYLIASPLAPRVPGLYRVTSARGYGGIEYLYSGIDVGLVTYGGFDIGRVPDDYDVNLMHLDDEEPVRIYSRSGSILNVNAQGRVSASKPVRIRAGRDIVDLPVMAQNLRATDVTSVIAGRDIYSTAMGRNWVQNSQGLEGGSMTINVGGPGTVYVEAGRNLGPLQPAAEINLPISYTTSKMFLLGGIIATGLANNRSLPREGADIFVVAGVANGKNIDGMITRYLDPAGADDVPYRYTQELADYLNALRVKRGLDKMAFTPSEAVAALRALSETEQAAFLYDVLFAELRTAADPIRNPENFQKYDRSYAAIRTFFPPQLGYPDTNGATTRKTSGSLDLRNATVQTQFGGTISVLAPVGRVLVGSQSATTLSSNPAATGILTLRGGDIRIMAEGNVLVNQSRIFTEQGGDIVMWSSNGDLNAGKGAKTSAFYPPLMRAANLDGTTSIDPAGLVTGAGIGALQTIVGQARANVYLIAPHGTVDIGDAGVRSTGDVNIAALRVLNADNIQARGAVTGVSTYQAPNTGALTEASNATAASQQAVAPQQQATQQQPSVIIVEVVGYGGDQGDSEGERVRQSPGRQGYDANAPVQVLGHGDLTRQEKQFLTEDERSRL